MSRSIQSLTIWEPKFRDALSEGRMAGARKVPGRRPDWNPDTLVTPTVQRSRPI